MAGLSSMIRITLFLVVFVLVLDITLAAVAFYLTRQLKSET